MAGAFKITGKPPFRDIEGVYRGAYREIMEMRRPLVQRQGRRFGDLAVDEAPKGETGKFAEGIRWRSFIQGGQMGFTVSDPQPLGTWIRGGTRAHAIPKPARPPGKPLHFYWAKGPAGAGMYTFYGVWHPGTKKNRYIGRAYRRWLPGARADMKMIGANFTRYLSGKGKAIAR